MTSTRLESFIEFIFPVKKQELGKFSLLSMLMFGILYIHATLRSLKDTIIVPNIGAEALSFIDLYLVLPCAVLFTLGYTKLTNVVPADRIFYIIKLAFLSIFSLFLLVIYPNADLIHPDPEKISRLVETYPVFKWWIKIYGKWTFAMFAVVVELWGPIVTVLSFWQFANKVTNSDEARRIYPTLALLGNFALVTAGSVIKVSAKHSTNVIGFNLTIIVLMIFVNILTYFISNKLLEVNHSKVQQKNNLSVFKSLKIILSSKYLLYIFAMVMAYGMINNMIEVQWKANIRQLYPDQNSYAKFMGSFTQYMGYSSIVIMMFGSHILRRFSWTAASLTTPIVVIMTSIFFFLSLIFKDELNGYVTEKFGINSTQFVVFIGMCQIILMKASKYGLFDPTKEMAFIAADEDIKTKGKAAVDVVGMRLSDTTAALIQSILLLFFQSALTSPMTISIMFIVYAILGVWVSSAKNLGKIYSKIERN